jgi:hypothetical protein
MATVATLIGRRTELEALDALLDGARAGRSGVLVLRGVPGIGKTALVDHCARTADGFRVLRAEGVEAEAELAFAGLHQLLRPLLDRVDRLPAVQRAALETAFGLRDGTGGDRFLVAAGTLGLLADAAEEQPLLCAVDDLQWLDRPSADALLFAARRLDAEPIAVLLAVRTDGPPLTRLPTLALAGLARHDAGELLDSSLPRPIASGCWTRPRASRWRCSSSRAARTARWALSSRRSPTVSRPCRRRPSAPCCSQRRTTTRVPRPRSPSACARPTWPRPRRAGYCGSRPTGWRSATRSSARPHTGARRSRSGRRRTPRSPRR